MPKYLVQGSYVGDGVKGLLKEGGSARREAVTKLIESVGGSIESFYYAFGMTDVFVVAELPDNATAAATSLMVNASGAVQVSVTVLLTPEEIDQASGIEPEYRPPGR